MRALIWVDVAILALGAFVLGVDFTRERWGDVWLDIGLVAAAGWFLDGQLLRLRR